MRKIQKSKITIITVVKNGMPYIEDSINSYQSQTYKNKELVVVYTKSTDGTEEFLKRKKNKIDKLIFDNRSQNKYEAINLGIKNATGNIIGVLHSDDFFLNRYVCGLGVDHLNYVDLNDISQVEIVKGPSSLLYANGTTNNENKVPINIPPIITTPICILADEPAPSANAKGTAPTTIAAVVIKIGRILNIALLITASSLLMPCSLNWLANSLYFPSNIFFEASLIIRP